MSYKILSLSNEHEWQYYLKSLPLEQQDVYYTPEYYSLYESHGDGKAQCFVFEMDGDVAMYPFLCNSVNRLWYNTDKEYFDIQGAYGYNGVISSSYNPLFVAAFYSEFDKWCKQNGIIAEFTRFHPLLNNYRFSENNMQIIFDRKTVFIDLRQEYKEICKQFQRTTKKQIRRAVDRYHLTVERHENSPESMELFYPIYEETMSRVIAEEYLHFSKEYFQELLKFKSTICFVAYKDRTAVAAIIAFYNFTFIHGHLGGAIESSLEMSPFSLLYTEMIRFGIEKRCHFLHVGGGSTTAPGDSLLQFKLNFSPTMADFYIGKRIHNKEVYDAAVTRWEAKRPDGIVKYKHHLLKYRY
jgi:hypothetical protein